MTLTRILTAVALAGGMAVTQPATAEEITLEFTVWNYSLDTIEDNVSQFEAANPPPMMGETIPNYPTDGRGLNLNPPGVDRLERML